MLVRQGKHILLHPLIPPPPFLSLYHCEFPIKQRLPFAAPTLTTLNDDCLLRICCLLNVREQFLLLQLDTRLRAIVLHLWQRKYANEFDWAQELQQGRRLSDDMQRKLLRIVAQVTRSLLNLRPELLTRKPKRMPGIESISFRQCTAKLLRHLPAMCNNLQQLQLQAGREVTHVQLAQLLAELPRLTHFELQPGEVGRSCPKEQAKPAALFVLPQTLETLKLPACALRAAATEIARLPQLRHLTAFLCDCGDDVDDEEQGKDAIALTTATVCACLTALKVQGEVQAEADGEGAGAGGEAATVEEGAEGRATEGEGATREGVRGAAAVAGGEEGAGRRQGAARRGEGASPEGAAGAASATPTASPLLACHIVAMDFHCQLDAQLPRLLRGQLVDVLRLERFAWHSRLTFHYDMADSSYKWMVQRPSVPHAMLNFLLTQAATLQELDFTGNVHATTFVAQLSQRLDARRANKPQCSYWYDGRPKPEVAAADAKATCNISNLPRFELELKRLTNAKATEGN